MLSIISCRKFLPCNKRINAQSDYTIKSLVTILCLLLVIFATEASATTFYVETATDSNNAMASCGIGDGCSLREAITVANGDSSTPHTINIPSNNYLISSALPAITKPMSLVGDGDTLTIIDAQNASIIFTSSVDITIDKMTIKNGYTTAADVASCLYSTAGNVTITNSTFNNCDGSATWTGPAVNVLGGTSLYINNSTFDDNDISANIKSAVPATVINSTFKNNDNLTYGASIHMTTASATLSVTGSDFLNNSASNGGAAIHSLCTADPAIEIESSTFTNNELEASGGIGSAISAFASGTGNFTISNSTFTGNKTNSTGGSGGAVYSLLPLTITDSTFDTNSIGNKGGAIYTSKQLNITNCLFKSNTAGSSGGGAIYSDSADTPAISISKTTFDSNTGISSGGGAIFSNAGITKATQSLFYGNTGTTGGAISSAGVQIFNSTFSQNTGTSGGGIKNNSGACLVKNSTFYKNTANQWQGYSLQTSSPCTLANNIFYIDPAVDASGYNNCRKDTGGDLISLGYNLDNDGDTNSCLLTATQDFVDKVTGAGTGDANLQALAANGGPTKTHAIFDTSNAYNTANDAICQDADVGSVDQRDKSRLINQCDRGSFEYVPNTAPIGGYTAENVIPAAQVAQATDGSGTITITWKGKDGETNNVTLNTFKYSVDGGSTWSSPVSGDGSAALATDWDDNGGAGYTTAEALADATAHSFTLNTKHTTELSGLNGVDQSDVMVQFLLYDGELNSISPVNSESFRVDNEPPTSTITSASYKPSTDTLTITGTNFLTMAAADTNMETFVDWTKFKWDINGDDATTDDITFAETDVIRLTVTNDTTLTLVFTSSKADDIEATADYSKFGGADTLDISAGFCKDESRNTSTTDAKANAPLTISEPVFFVTKTSAVYSDPISGTSNPKRIPGSLIDYTITVTNGGDGSPDADSTTISDEIDATTLWIYINSAPASAVTFTDGTTSSALALDAITYSDDAAPGPYTYDYTPSGEFDGLVTSLKVTTTGAFAFGGSPLPSFSLQYRVKVK